MLARSKLSLKAFALLCLIWPAAISLADNSASSNPTTRPTISKPADGKVLEISIPDLGNFEYDADRGGNIPDDVIALNGCTVRTHGYMIPLDSVDHITEFALVPTLHVSSYGVPPKVQQTLVVHCSKDKPVSFNPNELIVEGKLHVKEETDKGIIIYLFQVDATSVSALQQKQPASNGG